MQRTSVGFHVGSITSLFLLVIVLLAGCGHVEVDMSEVSIRSSDELTPTASPGSTAQMTLAGTKVPVQLEAKLQGTTFNIELTKHGEHFDSERYQSSPGGFSLQQAAGEEYEPALPLLRFPLTIDSNWTWTGVVSAYGDALPADAKVVVTRKSIFSCAVPIDAVVVTVNLTIKGAKKPIQRQMKFYFAKDRGLFRREFGDTSVREPSCN